MRVKWHLVTHLTGTGLLKLIDDLNELYDKFRDFENPHLTIRKCKDFGPYQVNVLTKDWDDLKNWYLEDTFADRYREDKQDD